MTKSKKDQLKKLRREIKWRKKALAHLKEWKKAQHKDAHVPNISAYTNSLGNELSDYKKTLKILKKMRQSEDSAPSEQVENLFAGCQSVIDKALPSKPAQVENPICERCINYHKHGYCQLYWFNGRHIHTIPTMSCPRFEARAESETNNDKN